MKETKNYCTTHHLYYRGMKCPLCEKERIDDLTEKYQSKNTNTENENIKTNRPINENDIQKLIEKFNVK